VHTTGSRPKLVVSADGRGVVSHAGFRLLADLADATGLTTAFDDTLRRLRPRGTGHDPGRIAVDAAVMLADGWLRRWERTPLVDGFGQHLSIAEP
jgi:hypothetical protein